MIWLFTLENKIFILKLKVFIKYKINKQNFQLLLKISNI